MSKLTIAYLNVLFKNSFLRKNRDLLNGLYANTAISKVFLVCVSQKIILSINALVAVCKHSATMVTEDAFEADNLFDYTFDGQEEPVLRSPERARKR